MVVIGTLLALLTKGKDKGGFGGSWCRVSVSLSGSKGVG